jgi:hypothetical protein
MVGGAAGAQLLFFEVGPRLRFAHHAGFDLLTVDGELGMRFPLGDLEPYAALGAGWAHATKIGPYGATASGLDLRLLGGVDWFATDVLSIGGRGSVETLHLSRGGEAGAPAASGWRDEGSGTGMAASVSLVVGLHVVDLWAL